jgi:ABC-type transport system substrate-binding protein
VKQNRLSLRKATITLATLLALVLASSAFVQSSSGAPAAPAASYTLSWWTVDGGGATSVTVGDYTLGGTAGQPDAGVWEGNDYTLGGGFWGGGGVVVETGDHYVYLPLVLKN